MKKLAFKNWIPILLAVVACGSSVEGQPTNGLEPGVVQGIATDSQGRPLAGVKVWVRPAVTTGLLQATTDAQGRYRVKGLPNLPYNAYAWHSTTYRGKTICFRLGSPNLADYDSFTPSKGVVRNFKWQMSGELPDDPSGRFGGEFRVFVPATPEDSKLELTLTPDGELADGSTGKTLRLPIDNVVQNGIPVGVYKVTAAFVTTSGARTALEVSHNDQVFSTQAKLQWQNESSCVGSTATGPERAYLWVRVPGGG